LFKHDLDIVARGAIAALVSNKGDPFLLFDLVGLTLPIAQRPRPTVHPLRRT